MSDKRFPGGFLDEVVARTDLADLIGRDVALKRNGREFSGLCPFHSEKSPSFTVVPVKGFAHCFGCGWHGDAIGYLQDAKGWSFVEAVEQLADRAGLEVPGRRSSGPPPVRRAPAPVVAQVTPEAVAAEEEKARRKAYAVWCEGGDIAGTPVEVYLAGRGIRVETQARLLALRFHPAVAYWWTPPRRKDEPPPKPQKLGEWPAMLAAVVGPDGRFRAVHQTFLADGGRGKRVIIAPDGSAQKVKKVKGQAGGGAIRLVPLAEGATALGGAEGIETAASVLQALGPEGLPVWALYSLGNVAGGALGQGRVHPAPPPGARPGVRLPSVAPDPERPGFLPPPGITEFTWFADGDGKDPLAADCTIRRGAARFAQAGVRFRVAKAPAGMDWNDILQRGGA